MAEVKMVDAIFTGGWGHELCDEIKIFINQHDDWNKKSYYHRPNSLKEISEEDYKIFVTTEEFAALEYYGHQRILMQYEDYIDVKFAMKDSNQLRSDSVFKLNVTVSASNIFNVIETHTALIAKQFDQLTQLSKQTFNEKVNVPNMDAFISKINQTMLLEDCCTDYLQSHLIKGWRIIAICPQPNQRRPDYVLGKILDEEELRSSALRGD